MKITTALLSLGLLVGSTGLVSGQGVMTVGMVLAECPDIPGAVACPGVATEFLASAPTPSDAQIVNLVLALAEAAQQPAVTMPICLNTADGLLVLADGVENDGQAAQIRDIAASLCVGATTAAIGGGGAPGPFDSLSSSDDDDDVAPLGDDEDDLPPPPPPPPDDDDEDDLPPPPPPPPGDDDDDCPPGESDADPVGDPDEHSCHED